MLFTGKVRVSLVGLVVAGGAVAATALGPAGPAVGQSSPSIQEQVQVNSPATLVAKGAGVDVSVAASCSGVNVETANVSVGLTEAVGKNIANGAGGETINCTGATQTSVILVTAESGKAFEKGSAIATGIISTCTIDFSFCTSQTVQPTIKIKKS